MKQRLGILLLLTSTFSLFTNCIAQKQGQARIDSLLSQLPKEVEDTSKVNLLGALSSVYGEAYPDECFKYAQQELELSERLNWKRGIAKANNSIAGYYNGKADYTKALEYYFKALKTVEDLRDKDGSAFDLASIASVYDAMSNNPKAVEYYLKSVQLYDELGNKRNMAQVLLNLGNVYEAQSDYSNALKYDIKSIDLFKELGSKSDLANVFLNTGNVYKSISDYPKTLEYYFKSLKIAEESDDKKVISYNFLGIGNVYKEEGDYSTSLEYYFKSLHISQELGDKKAIAGNFCDIGSVYDAQANYSKALEYEFKSLKIYQDSGLKREIGENLGLIADVYLKESDYLQALNYSFQSLRTSNEIGDKRTIGGNFAEIGKLYLIITKDSSKILVDSLFSGNKNNALQMANNYLDSAVIVFKEIGDPDNLLTAYRDYSEAEELSGDYKAALENYKNYTAIKDSVFSDNNKKKLALIENQRNEYLAQQEASKEKRKRNLELVGIALFILTFLIGVMLLSSAKLHPVALKLLGILALLMMFEFIYLLIDPLISEWTNDNPIYTLVAMVGIAAVLIPTHHKLEHWIKEWLEKRHLEKKKNQTRK